MKKTTNKSQLVKEHLLTKGKITSWEAIQEYGATRLSDIIFRLRKSGYNILTNNIAFTDRYGNTGQYAEYVYIGGQNADTCNEVQTENI